MPRIAADAKGAAEIQIVAASAARIALSEPPSKNLYSTMYNHPNKSVSSLNDNDTSESPSGPETPRNLPLQYIFLPTPSSLSAPEPPVMQPPLQDHSQQRRSYSSTSLDALQYQYTPPYPSESREMSPVRRRTISLSSLAEPQTPKTNAAASGSKPTSKRKPRQSEEEKLDTMLTQLKECNWTLGEFLHALFRAGPTRNRSHAKMVERFLRGTTGHGLGDILKWWMEDPSGIPETGSSEAHLLYSLDVPYLELKHARAVMTSFAAQTVKAEMFREVRSIAESKSGMHGTGTSPKGRKELARDDIGPNTLSDVKTIIEKTQPLTWRIICDLVTPPPRVRNGVVTIRKTRPPELVSTSSMSRFTATEIISTIDFAHTFAARRLPAARAILYFACGAQQTLFTYGSRVGHLLSWKATCRLLRRLGEQTGARLRELGESDTKAGIIRFDNVQRWAKQREMRMGREDRMNIGVAATVAEVIDFDPEAFDLDEHLSRIAKNERKNLTVDKLLDMIDMDHLCLMGELQWLETIVVYIPRLNKYRSDLAKVRKTEGAKMRVEVHRTVVHPLGTVAKNEAITVELRDALLDFLAQMGIKDGYVKRRIVFVGGDGMSFEKTIILQYYCQFQDGPLRTLAVIEPFLEIWHTVWTFLSSIYETHWGEPLTKDPSRMGHSATKIGQKTPSNLKKVDFYPASYTAYTILDARILDCWRLHFEADDIFSHFEALSEEEVPSFEELRLIARSLYRRYGTRRAYQYMMRGKNVPDTPDYVPAGSPWVAPRVDETSQSSAKATKATKGKQKASTKNSVPDEPPFKGDQTLAQSIMFMHITAISREMANAIADGDIGRVYEGLKYILFTFAGSKHHPKYANMLLEQITRIELESSPKKKAVFLKNWLVNTVGEAGRFKAGDIMQEALNLVLQEMISHNDAEWDSPRVREIIAPNVAFMNDLKNHWGDGLGLASRRSKHPEPHSRPEIRTLLELYKTEELHMFRAGRSYNRAAEDVDTFSKGIANLQNGKLKKWIDTTIRARDLAKEKVADTVNLDSILNDVQDEDEDDFEEEAEGLTAGEISIVGGEMVIDVAGDDDDDDASDDDF
ncbi:hypothetical protein EIP86_008743 [Pleurotus ostreatoroseus]|nr:hypothetical protein EIP86_008743 [Pleurotus ostreatoroseus]